MAYPAEKKAEVVVALKLGMTAYEASKKFKIPRATVRKWESGLIKSKSAEKCHNKKEKKVEELIAEALQEQITAMIEIAKNAQDASYFRSQRANDIAILFGVIADKSLSILRAAERRAELERKAREAERSGNTSETISGTAENQR